MQEMLVSFSVAFIPLFVALDPVGLVPVFWSLTQGIAQKKIKKIITQALVTAFSVSVGFIFLGKMTFKALNITVSDFQMAGGVVLLVLAIKDMMGFTTQIKSDSEDIGVVPLGLPLMAGPAVLTTLLILIDTAGVVPTLAALIVNFVIANFTFRYSEKIRLKIGVTGIKALSKIISLLLAAIAISLIRKAVGV